MSIKLRRTCAERAPNTTMPRSRYIPNGAEIARLRCALGWTQDELAEKAGYDVRTIQKAEGKRKQRLDEATLQTIADALGVELEKIILSEQREEDSALGSSDNAGVTTGNKKGPIVRYHLDVDIPKVLWVSGERQKFMALLNALDPSLKLQTAIVAEVCLDCQNNA